MTRTAETLRTARMVLRRPTLDDLPAYMAFATGPRMTYLNGPMTTRAATEKFLSFLGHWQARGFGRYIMAEPGSDRPMGFFGPVDHDPAVGPELTWTLWSDADAGRGLALEAGREVIRHLAQDCDWTAVAAHTHEDNQSSRRLAEKLGGVLGYSAANHANWVHYDFDLTAITAKGAA